MTPDPSAQGAPVNILGWLLSADVAGSPRALGILIFTYHYE